MALGLAQIGEFSFIPPDLARRYGLMPVEGHSVLVGAAIVSITLNPLLFRFLGRVERWLGRRPRLWALLNARAERRLAGAIAAAAGPAPGADGRGRRPAVVVGCGPVGQTVGRLLREAGLTTVVIDLNMDTVSEPRGRGRAAVFGDASREAVPESAGVAAASHLVLTLPHAADRAAVVAAARNLTPPG